MPAGAAIGEATRRELIARGIALAGTGSDRDALRAMIRAEQVLISTYQQLRAAAALPLQAQLLANEFLAQEQAHVSALRKELRHRGGRPPRQPRGLGSIASASPRDALRLLVELERAALSVYYTELARVRDFALARIAAAIMADEAQHTSLLRELLSPEDIARAVPGAFVYGTS